MKISVIIPTFNEASFVEQVVGSALDSGADEVVLADGGSTDQTVLLAEPLNCKIVHARRGRGSQLNAGAQVAIGDILLFLHADASLASDGCQQIRTAMQDQTVAFGAFEQVLDNRGWIYRLIEFGNAFRGRVLKTVYGDQGIFIRRSMFDSLGGFDEIPLMEDFSFSSKLRRQCADLRKTPANGSPRAFNFTLLPGPLKVSTRRWEANGPIRQTIANWRTTISYMRGTDPEVLAQAYYGRKESQAKDSQNVPQEPNKQQA